MCTLTYTPLGDGKFLIGSNRDESTKRAAATSPIISEKAGQKLIYPMDPEAKGSWIASSETGRTACLLNGAFEPHEHKPPYRMSRGLVLLDSFQFTDLFAMLEKYDLNRIEPFTLVAFEENSVSEMRWDGIAGHVKEFDGTQATIWCSALLYSKQEQQSRQEWFDKWRETNPDPGIEQVQAFHKEAGGGKILAEITTPQGFLIKTVSVTTLNIDTNKTEMIYDDLQQVVESSLVRKT